MPHALIVFRDDDARRHLAEAARAQAFSVSPARNAETGLCQMGTRDPTTERACPEGTRFGHLEGSSRRMRKLHHLISRVAPSRASVLASGESGSGKERVARTGHDLGPRRHGAFVAVNCGAVVRMGAESSMGVDVRILVTTNRPPLAAVAEGRL